MSAANNNAVVDVLASPSSQARFLQRLIMLFAATTVVGQSARKYFKAGKDFYDVNKYEISINQFSNAIELPDWKMKMAHSSLYRKIIKHDTQYD